MSRIGRAYSDAGKSHVWGQIKVDAIRIQRQRDAKAKKAAQKAAQEVDSDALLLRHIGIAFLYMFVGFAVIAGIAFFIFGVEQ